MQGIQSYQDIVKKAVDETVAVQGRHEMNANVSGDPAKASGLALDGQAVVAAGAEEKGWCSRTEQSSMGDIKRQTAIREQPGERFINPLERFLGPGCQLWREGLGKGIFTEVTDGFSLPDWELSMRM